VPPTPTRKLAVITCMDARLNVERILGLEEGDAHVIRNAGALITDDVRRSLAVSRSIGTEDVALILHTDCAGHSGDIDDAARTELAKLDTGARAYVYDVDTRELRELRD
jgi:carbonic anhydrase